MRIRCILLSLALLIGAAPAGAVTDHLQCYKIKDTDLRRLKGIVDLDVPSVGLAPGCKLGPAKLYCTAAAKTVVAGTLFNGNVPLTPLPYVGPASETDRVCYSLRCPAPGSDGPDRTITDQFGTRTVTGLRTSMLCTPAATGAGSCGNGSLDPGEACEGANLGGASCQTLGFASGTLACSPSCTFDTAACVPATPACSGSSPTWTSTPDYASVSSCVSSASRGDTIFVSAGDGTETYTSALTLTRGVNLIGPGRDSLVIGRTGTGLAGMMIAVYPDASAIANEETIEVTGFTFSGNDGAGDLMHVIGAPRTGPKPFKNLIIGDNRFKNTTATAISIQGQTRGVVYSNFFDRVSINIRPWGNGWRSEWESGMFPFSFGSPDNLYIEDNTFLCSTGFHPASGTTGWIESGQSGRQVIRYNSWNLANCTNQSEYWDVHGFQNYVGPPSYPDESTDGQSGTMVTEYYGNDLTSTAGYRWLLHRGSWGLFFNNTLSGANAGTLGLQQYDRGCNSYVNATWPPPNGQIQNVYGFNNTKNGAQQDLVAPPGSGFPVSAGSYNNVCPPVENQDFWNYNASCTASACVTGIGRGTTPPTGTCTMGTAYWVASTPTPTIDKTVIQDGVLYLCTSPNVWTPYYTPFIYPHPLRTG